MVFHWDGHRIVRNYKGSKRPEGIDSELWKMLGPHDSESRSLKRRMQRKQPKQQEEKPAPSFGSKGKKKKVFDQPGLR